MKWERMISRLMRTKRSVSFHNKRASLYDPARARKKRLSVKLKGVFVLIFDFYILTFYSYSKLFQLLFRNCRRCINHHIAACIIFREGNEIADGVGATKKRTQAIEAKGDTSVWRRSKFKGFH